MEQAVPAEATSPGKKRRWPRIVVLLLVLTWVVVRFWPAPADADPLRPAKVRATSLEQRTLTVQGWRVRYIDEGPRDAEVLILLPGHTSRIEEIDHLVAPLAESLRVIIFDFPGSGYSEKPVISYDLALYEEIIVGVMDSLQIARAHLGGGSLGGNLVFSTAARFPERFVRLLPWAPGSAWPASPWIARAGWLIAGYLPFGWMADYQSTFWYAEDDPLRQTRIDETFAYYDEVGGPGFTAMYWGIALDTVRRSLFDVAPRVPHPTLLCWGEHDATPYMTEGVARLGELLPRGEVVRFDDAPHAIANAEPELLLQRIREFLSRPEEELPGGR